MGDRYGVNRDGARWRMVDGEIVVIHVASSYYYGLNKTGTFVWNLLAEQDQTFDELVEAVAEHYGRPRAAVDTDVRRLVDDLVREDLVAQR